MKIKDYFTTLKKPSGITIILLNVGNVAVNIASGLANNVFAGINTALFILTQLNFYASNQERRVKLEDLQKKLEKLEDETKVSDEIKIANRSEKGLAEFGLHTSHSTATMTSGLLTALNSTLTLTATAITVTANRDNEQACGEYCNSSFCISVYALNTTAFLLTVFEQHVKSINLEVREQKLSSRINELNERLNMMKASSTTAAAIHLPQVSQLQTASAEKKKSTNEASYPTERERFVPGH